MGGWVSCIGACFACRQVFTFSPTRVPSYNGEPVCASCIVRANAKRAELGLEPIVPLPGAYEPDEEGDIPWN